MALAHAILTALHAEPASGYDLSRRFQTSLGFFWQASHQQIYRELKQMAAAGWLAAVAVTQTGRPDKIHYSLTAAGEQELQTWLAAESSRRPGRDDLFVKLYNLGHCDLDHLLAEIRDRHAGHSAQLALYLKIRDRHYLNPDSLPLPRRGIWLVLSAGIRNEQMYIDWCDEALELLA